MKNSTTTTDITIFPRLSNIDRQWKGKVITLNIWPQSTCTRKRLQSNNAKKKKEKNEQTKNPWLSWSGGLQVNLTLLHNPCSEFPEGFQVFSSLQGQKEGELKLRTGQEVWVWINSKREGDPACCGGYLATGEPSRGEMTQAGREDSHTDPETWFYSLRNRRRLGD